MHLAHRDRGGYLKTEMSRGPVPGYRSPRLPSCYAKSCLSVSYHTHSQDLLLDHRTHRPLSCSLWLQLGFTNDFLCQCSALGSLGASEACLLVLAASGRSWMKFKSMTACPALPRPAQTHKVHLLPHLKFLKLSLT